MSARDEFLKREVGKLLKPGEQVLNTATVFTGPLLFSSLFGVFGQMMMLSYYFAALTNQRLILIGTGMGFTGLKTENRGVTEYPLAEVVDVTPGGMMNQKSITLKLRDGTSTKISFNTMVRQIDGQKAFAAEAADRIREMIK